MPADPNRILIIEDDAGLAELLGEGLRRQGLQVSTVGSGRECLDWAAGNEVDLLVIDYSLPDMTGAALVEELQRNGRLPPFLVTTGHGDEEVAVRLMKLGALDYLVKDVNLLDRLPGAVVRALRDVGHQRRLATTEAALAESQSLQRAIFESTADMIWSVDAERFGLLTFNQALEGYFLEQRGIALQTGMRPEDLFPDNEFVERWKRYYRQALASGSFTTEYPTFSGKVTLLLTLNVLKRAGAIFGVSVFGKDISELKRAEKVMARYQLISQHARDPLLLINSDSSIVEANQAAVDLYGYSRDELLGLKVSDLRREVAPEVLRRQMELAFAGGRLFEAVHTRRDGTTVPVEVSARGVMVDGQPMLLSVVRDITARKENERQRQQVETKYKMLFDSMLDGFALHEIVCDDAGKPVDYRFLTVNPAFERLTGLKAAQVAGRRITEFLQRIEPFWIETYGKVALTGEPAEFEHYNIDLNKHFAVAAFCPAAGQFAAIFVDVTEKKRSELALARDEAELAAIYDNAPVMMMLIGSDLKVRRFNRAAFEFSGKTPDVAIGRPPGEMLGCLHALDDPRGCGFGPDCSNCALRRHVLDSFKTGATHRKIETQPRFVRGREVIDVTLLASTARIEIGKEVMVLLCLEDISQQKQAEHHVREQAALLEVTQDAIVVIDLDDFVTYWNRGAERVYGWTVPQAVGRKIGDLFPTIPEEERISMKRAVHDHGEWAGEIRRIHRDGRTLTIQRRANLMCDTKGEPRGFLVIDTDITEARRVEEQLLRAQRLDSLGSLAGGVAHDLNNVFTPIMISIEMLGALALESHDREVVQLLADSTRRGSDIVRQLLLFSRGSDSPRADVNLTLLIRDLRRMMEGTFPKNIRLSAQVPTDLWSVHGDQTQLHQVLLNLCVNARDAMPAEGRLTIAAENVHVDGHFASRQLNATPGPHVLIRVTDTGTGIPPDVIEKIFDPFFTTKPVGQGTGLGLSTTLGIVRSHGGFITVKSQPGAGSEFGVYLPAKTSIAGALGNDTMRQALRGQGELILVVDDETNIRLLIERTLKGHGYTTGSVADGAEALAFIASRGTKVSLVVTDVMMPNVDGIQLVRDLRKNHPRLPVVAISGTQGHRAAFERMPPPQIRHLVKPFSIDALLAIVREALDDAAGPTTAAVEKDP